MRSISQSIVHYFRVEKHMTLKDIGGMMGLSESFVSNVGKGKRSFTLVHLGKLEKHIGVPLPIILARVINVDDVSDKLKIGYECFRCFFEAIEQLKEF